MALSRRISNQRISSSLCTLTSKQNYALKLCRTVQCSVLTFVPCIHIIARQNEYFQFEKDAQANFQSLQQSEAR